MCVNSEGSGETVRMRRLTWAFAGRICDKYHNLMSWLKVVWLPTSFICIVYQQYVWDYSNNFQQYEFKAEY